MHAVIRTGGKQYRVTLGQQLRVDRLAGDAGDTVDLTDVLLLSNDDGTTVGNPTVENARVVASIVEQSRGAKINVFKYKSKIRYRKLRGHRQRHTDLRIEEIVGPDGASHKHEKREFVAEEPAADDDAARDEAEADVEVADAVDAEVADDDAATVADATDEAPDNDAADDDVEPDEDQEE